MNVTVIGAGVGGLTCAVVLAEAGFPVRVLAARRPELTTSAVAAAFWYPYLAEPRERVAPWALTTLDRCRELAGQTESGVTFRRTIELGYDLLADPWWRSALPWFRRLSVGELPGGALDGRATELPVLETPRYLPYLERRLAAAGGELEILDGPLSRLEQAPGELLVCCPGLGARELVGDDSLTPVRGQVVLVENPGIETVLLAKDHPRGVTYVIPRSDGCVVGTTSEAGREDTEVDPATTEALLARAGELEPRLKGARVLTAAAGLRPVRPAVRLELEHVDGRPVIHDYGHGGSGFTLSWGCAEEVLSLARSVL
jgi:D-amino-acid oxidase